MKMVVQASRGCQTCVSITHEDGFQSSREVVPGLDAPTRHKYIDSKKDIQKVLNLLLIACLHDSVVGGNVPLLPPSLGSDLVDSRTVTQISKQKI